MPKKHWGPNIGYLISASKTAVLFWLAVMLILDLWTGPPTLQAEHTGWRNGNQEAVLSGVRDNGGKHLLRVIWEFQDKL